MKLIRWTHHALQNLNERNIDRTIAEQTIADPEFTILDSPDREIRMRRYFDKIRQREMLLRVIIAEVGNEIVVITLYKTSQINRYLKGLLP